MANYDFNDLSSTEFEKLSRDLLQKELNITFESFPEGRDGGIDFRYSKSTGNDIIIQVKKYSNFSSLLSNLKKEVKKLDSIKPKRYIITTSIELTAQRKEKIYNIFKPFIQSFSDIYGADDLCNLINNFPEVVDNYPNLWNKSMSRLEKIVFKGIYVASDFEKKEIIKTKQTYVMNDSFYKAMEKLQQHKFVIISGIPGIGKTTLARMLIFKLLEDKYEEFIYISNSISEGFDTYKNEKSQIFYFDDFLGDVSLQDEKLSEERNIVKFIEMISSSSNKLFILTTKEYILQEAISKSNKFLIDNIQRAKSIIDLRSYTDSIRAKIFAKHFNNSDIPQQYLDELSLHENHSLLINHSNYNPRIIEYIVKQEVWKEFTGDDFTSFLLQYFDNPSMVWENAFNELDELSQYLLIILASLNVIVIRSELYEALYNFKLVNNLYNNLSTAQLNISLKKLHGSFIASKKFVNNEIIYSLHNSSIKDFIINYISNDTLLTKMIINGAIYLDQTIGIFFYHSNKLANRVNLNNECLELLLKRINTEFYTLKPVSLSRNFYGQSNIIDFYYLSNILTNLKHPQVLHIASELLQNNHYLTAKSIDDWLYFYVLLNFDIDLSKTNFDIHKFIEILSNLDNHYLEYIPRLLLKDVKNNYILRALDKHPELINALLNILIKRIDMNNSIYYCFGIIDLLQDLIEIEKSYNIDLTLAKEKVQKAVEIIQQDYKNDDFYEPVF